MRRKLIQSGHADDPQLNPHHNHFAPQDFYDSVRAVESAAAEGRLVSGHLFGKAAGEMYDPNEVRWKDALPSWDAVRHVRPFI
jgi:hypothetical protein